MYHQRGIDLLVDVVPIGNILFGSEMVGAVRGVDPDTGNYYDDTKIYIDHSTLDDAGEASRSSSDNVRACSLAWRCDRDRTRTPEPARRRPHDRARAGSIVVDELAPIGTATVHEAIGRRGFVGADIRPIQRDTRVAGHGGDRARAIPATTS